MATKKKLLQAAAGAAGGEALNVEDVFSTYLYTGTQATQSITNGIDLSGEGGLVWLKDRQSSNDHFLFDTERGAPKSLSSANSAAEVASDTDTLTSFNADGFTLGADFDTNRSGNSHASWTFRKAPKFFDVVTYTGTDATQTINHNLGSVPGCIIFKNISEAGNWEVVFPNQGSSDYLYGYLNLTGALAELSYADNVLLASAPTSTSIEIEQDDFTGWNKLGSEYVAYLFAHNDGDGEFGPTGDQDVIKCGSYTGNGSSTGPEIDLGFEPQWLMVKSSTASESWYIINTMSSSGLRPNASSAETTAFSLNAGSYIGVTSTGFNLTGWTDASLNGSGQTYIYIAIRRGPMAVPESATEVFAPVDDLATGNRSSGFTTDAYLLKRTDNTNDWRFWSRLTDENMLSTNSTAAETGYSGALDWDQMDGVTCLLENTPNINYFWKRAPNYFDVVAYTGTGVARTVSHNLGVAPEMMWIKRRDSAGGWVVYHSGLNVDGDNLPETDYIVLQSTAVAFDLNTAWNDTAPSSNSFTVGTYAGTNPSGGNMIAYLFASLDGVSKVGSYTGNGSSDGDTQDINCGFTSGARFVLIKRTSSTGNWMLYDTERGIVSSGDDKRLELNGAGAQDTNENCIEPLSSGFTVRWDIDSSASNNPNISGSTYIFYAIA